MRILGIAGSLRQDSYNRRLLHAAASLLPHDAEFTLFEGLGALPPYDPDVEEKRAPDEPVMSLRAALARADGVLFATPEYNASLPGVLKNALDWASRPFPDNALRDKPVAVIGASTGLFGAVWAQAELRKVLQTIGARVVDDELPIALADQAFDEAGDLVSPEARAALASLLGTLLGEVRAGPKQATCAVTGS